MNYKRLSPRMRAFLTHWCELEEKDKFILCQRIKYHKSIREVGEVLSLSPQAIKMREDKIINNIINIIGEL